MNLDPLGLNLDPLGMNPSFRKKVVRPHEGVDPAISAEMGKDEERPAWVRAADFLTGHFPDNSKVKPEVQTVDGKLQVNVPETAEVPFLQSPEMAIGAGAAGAIKATGSLAAKVVKGVEEAAGYMTGGVTDVAKAATKGATQVVRNIDPLNLEAMVKGGRVNWWRDDVGVWAGNTNAASGRADYVIHREKGGFSVSIPNEDKRVRAQWHQIGKAKTLDEAKAIAESSLTPESLDSLVKGGRIGELPKYAEGSAINLERMDTTQDVKQLQNVLTKQMEAEIGKKTVSWDETAKLADELGWDSKELLKQHKKKGGFTTAEHLAARQINMNAIGDLNNTLRNIPADRAARTDAMRFGILDKINNYMEIGKATSEIATGAGRSLNIYKKMISENPEFAVDAYRRKVLQGMMDNMGGRGLTDDMIDELGKVDFKDPKAVRELIQKYHKASIFDMFYEAWMNGLLSAPPTHFANIIGNSITMATKIPESAIAGVLKGKMPLGEVRAETVGALQGIKDGVRSAIKAFETGVPSDLFTKIETRHMNAIPGKLGEKVRIPTRALTAADEFFKSIAYRSEMNRQAYLHAEKEGLKGRALGERMAEIMNDPYGKSFKIIHDKAHEESLYRTFNKPLGEFGNSLMRLRDKAPGLRYVIPFIRTPVNIAKFALERTPFNFGKIAFDYKAGKIPKDVLKQEMAKPIMGSLIAAATTIAVLDGSITGGPPKNKKERELLYAKGWQPYAIKVGDKYYSYNRLEPIGSVIGMTADFVNESRSEAEINEKAGRIAVSFSRNIASKTFMQGVSSILDAVSDPERYGGQWLEKTAGSVVPAVVGRVATTYDPYIRDVTTPWEAIQARIPYYSTKLPYKPGANIQGLEFPAERAGTPMQRLLSPMTISKEVEPWKKQLIDAELELTKFQSGGRKIKSETKEEALRETRRTP